MGLIKSPIPKLIKGNMARLERKFRERLKNYLGRVEKVSGVSLIKRHILLLPFLRARVVLRSLSIKVSA
jgi:hypothetical protein